MYFVHKVSVSCPISSNERIPSVCKITNVCKMFLFGVHVCSAFLCSFCKVMYILSSSSLLVESSNIKI